MDVDDEWTLGTLRTYLDSMIDALRRELAQRIDGEIAAARAAMMASDLAIAKAERAVDHRFLTVTELQRQVADQATQFATRSEADAAHQRITLTIGELWTAVRAQVSRVEYEAAHQRLVEQIGDLTDRVNRTEGRSKGLSVGWGYLVAAIGVIGVMVSIYIAVNRL